MADQSDLLVAADFLEENHFTEAAEELRKIAGGVKVMALGMYDWIDAYIVPAHLTEQDLHRMYFEESPRATRHWKNAHAEGVAVLDRPAMNILDWAEANFPNPETVEPPYREQMDYY